MIWPNPYDELVGAKSEGSLTQYRGKMLFTTDLGGANFLGAISAFELPDLGLPVAPTLTIVR